MKITKSNKLREQAKVAHALKAGLLRLIRAKFPGAALAEKENAVGLALVQSIELSAQGFDPVFKARPSQQVDRTTSMLSGPFFTSAEFPIPSASTGMLFPVAQLELAELSAAAQEDLGDGLLQLWFDVKSLKEHIRVIPSNRLNAADATPFDWKAPPDFDGYPLPLSWNLDPCGPMVQTITGLKSTGVQSQGGHIEACLDMLGEDAVSEWLWVLTKLFIQSTPAQSNKPVGVLGTFYSIQYASADVGMKCLLSICWGSSGGAQIFYRTEKKQSTQFAFHSCVR